VKQTRREVLLAALAASLASRAQSAEGKPLRGLFPIGQTPCTPDNQIDLDCLAAEVKFCNRGGVHGFVWPQIASGWASLTQKERIDGAEAILAAGKGGKTLSFRFRRRMPTTPGSSITTRPSARPRICLCLCKAPAI